MCSIRNHTLIPSPALPGGTGMLEVAPQLPTPGRGITLKGRASAQVLWHHLGRAPSIEKPSRRLAPRLSQGATIERRQVCAILSHPRAACSRAIAPARIGDASKPNLCAGDIFGARSSTDRAPEFYSGRAGSIPAGRTKFLPMPSACASVEAGSHPESRVWRIPRPRLLCRDNKPAWASAWALTQRLRAGGIGNERKKIPIRSIGKRRNFRLSRRHHCLCELHDRL